METAIEVNPAYYAFLFQFHISPINGVALHQTARKLKLEYKNGSKFIRILLFTFYLAVETLKKGLYFEIARCFCTLLQFETVLRYRSLIIRIKIRRRSKKNSENFTVHTCKNNFNSRLQDECTLKTR